MNHSDDKSQNNGDQNDAQNTNDLNQFDHKFQNNLSATSQITFKLSATEKENILNDATSLGVNLSEYCRIKVISIDSDLIVIRNKLSRLEKENRVLKVKLNFYKESTIDQNSVVLQFNEKQRLIIDKLFADYHSKDLSIGANIIRYLTHITTWDSIWLTLFSRITLTKKEVRETLDPDQYLMDDDDD